MILRKMRDGANKKAHRSVLFVNEVVQDSNQFVKDLALISK